MWYFVDSVYALVFHVYSNLDAILLQTFCGWLVHVDDNSSENDLEMKSTTTSTWSTFVSIIIRIVIWFLRFNQATQQTMQSIYACLRLRIEIHSRKKKKTNADGNEKTNTVPFDLILCVRGRRHQQRNISRHHLFGSRMKLPMSSPIQYGMACVCVRMWTYYDLKIQSLVSHNSFIVDVASNARRLENTFSTMYELAHCTVIIIMTRLRCIIPHANNINRHNVIVDRIWKLFVIASECEVCSAACMRQNDAGDNVATNKKNKSYL